eukprot:TRINITY_DN9091_c0_g1_i1.p1 TRINITY_DN9091_c0_g1~~TRINITY_DN9091_c0_g1_i1.p1  ORF type:complete len:805 (+),score=174.67 TRINITY_DN9091_c0_g1_i1:428-2842(+)
MMTEEHVPAYNSAVYATATRRGIQLESPIPFESLPNPTSVDEKYTLHRTYSAATGKKPPPASYPYQANDSYNCSPRFMRLTTHTVPISNSVAKKVCIPTSLYFQPFAEIEETELPISIIDFGDSGIVRCRRCKSFINPFVKFIEQGHKYTCIFCRCKNDVPAHYFSPLDMNGDRTDLDVRPELWRGSYEIVAPADYTAKIGNPAKYLFVVDVSYRSINSEFVNTFISSVQRVLEIAYLDDPLTEFGIIAYNSMVHYFDMKSGELRIISSGDNKEVYIPLPLESIMTNYATAKETFLLNLESLFSVFSAINDDEASTGTAIEAAIEVLSETGGKILVFSTCIPSTGLGALETRYAVEESANEKTMYTPQNNYYTELGRKALSLGIGIDIFSISVNYTDLVSLGKLCSITGGQLYYYPWEFSAQFQDRLYRDLYRNLVRENGFSARFRVRCSHGYSIASVLGHGVPVEGTPEFEMATISSDSSYIITLENDNNLEDGKPLYFQAVMIYNAKNGETRLRIHNLRVVASDIPMVIFNSADVDTILSTLLRKNVSKNMYQLNPQNLREKVFNDVIQIFAAYKKNCRPEKDKDRFMVPESIRHLPMLLLGSIKSPLLSPLLTSSPYNVLADSRAFYASLLNNISLKDLSPLFYPHLYRVDNLAVYDYGNPDEQTQCIKFPIIERLSIRSLDTYGIFLFDAVTHMYLWIGNNSPSNIIEEILTPDQLAEPNRRWFFQPQETPMCTRLVNIIYGSRRSQRCLAPNVEIVREGSNMEYLLIEDGLVGTNIVDMKDFTSNTFIFNLHMGMKKLL